ncbi:MULTISPECIES: 1-phosphofructokinase [unclassified Paenibacillus]|uniref:1-phosphofructokinase n=1 Tax=unclassified Paenibacillus TaxID=185978 RepID=UPI001AE84D9A|nr:MULTISPECIES: 1-phosphofructokinase [unclassified Paenibacillus]MBP1157661.1 1-phosphofructokinase [Paenibacillus sp. PvP091]MBP1171602.1 1-phosphofructokinase [Paenibacillus sp. PvR098]MBP2437983.1 1-phosphofructokinase [Paenibacillus sp. PvP052]
MIGSVLTVTMNPAVDKTVTVDKFSFGQLNRITSVRLDAGGKGINVAKVLKHFSVDVSAWGLQCGPEGQMLMTKLREYGIPSHFLEAEGRTRVNLKVVDEFTKQTTELNEPGFSPSPKLLDEFVQRFKAGLEGVSLVVLGGSLPPGTPGDFYKQLIQTANGQGVRTILDADGEALAKGIEAAPYAIKPNIHELETLIGAPLTSDEAIAIAGRKLVRSGIANVIVSMGGSGSIIVNSEQAFRVKPFPIEPKSTVGAGDSMVAAMVYCYLHNKSLEETARWTSAAGTVTASKQGTEVCTLNEVQEKLELVDICPLTV